MSERPDRIWTDDSGNYFRDDYFDEGRHEYIDADLVEPLLDAVEAMRTADGGLEFQAAFDRAREAAERIKA